MTLDELPDGGQGRIAAVHGAGVFRRRLLEIGFLPGTMVSRAGAAPTGDPLLFRLRSTVVSLRRADAARVELEAA
jgi:ferrous iron transport protein A